MAAQFSHATGHSQQQQQQQHPLRAPASPPHRSKENSHDGSDNGGGMMFSPNFEDDASATGSITIDVATNFDNDDKAAAPLDFTTKNVDDGHHRQQDQDDNHQVSADESGDTGGGHGGQRGGDGDGDSHFSDIAQAAAKAMENIDMDKLCSELFTQEMLEEVVGAQAGVVQQPHQQPQHQHQQGGGNVTTNSTGAMAINGGGGGGGNNNGAHQGQCLHQGVVSPELRFHAPAAAPRGDCGSSASEVSEVTVPSTIAFQSAMIPAKTAPPQLQQQPLLPKVRQQPHHRVAHPQAQAQAAPRPQVLNSKQGGTQPRLFHQVASPTKSSPLQFSQPRNDDGPACYPILKKQRSNEGLVATALPQQALRAPQAPRSSPAAEVRSRELVCAKCGFPGADVRVRCPTGGCAYHARCMDLSLCKPVSDTKATQTIEILPLSFVEMDSVQGAARAAFLRSGLGASGVLGAKRARDDPTAASADPSSISLPTVVPSHGGAQPRRTVQCYDPSRPRTGRWSDEEISFRDTLISHFLAGALPLQNGLKLNDFLPAMLKSKQSRLAKKMKHAKLSTKYFYPKAGCVPARPGLGGAAELSRLERDFVASIPDPVERSEVKFHMASQWREHFASRCASSGVPFDGRRWLGSVEDMERRLAFEKERHRLVKRRFMMGKAMEKDCDSRGRALEKGVFVRTTSEEGARDEYELVVEKSVGNSAGSLRRDDPSAGGTGGVIAVAPNKEKESSSRGWSSDEPNFKHAAPFLAGIASYIERNGVPFEHVDVWVPSFVRTPTATEGSGSPGADAPKDDGPSPGDFRLCFGGSVTMGVQIVDEPPASSSGGGPSAPSRRPIAPETKSSLGLFGRYSEKFSFSSGCGLPGRIFRSGVPAWEQHVAEAPASQFERRGGALQFGVKTAVGLPVDSPNVGRIVLVMYSRHDREKDERLVGRMTCDLKLLCPSPRWKLVVDVDSPLGGVEGAASGKGVRAGGTVTASSLEAPPPVNTGGASRSPGGSPVPASATLSRAVSAGSGGVNTAPNNVSVAAPRETPPVHPSPDPVVSHKDKQIKDLLLLLAGNIPSSPSSDPLAEHLQSIMSLRLILLRGDARAPEEEALVETVLVLYESYLHAGRSTKDIAVMVARDFAFHLGHQRTAGQQQQQPRTTARHDCNNAGAPRRLTMEAADNRGPPPTMYAAVHPPPAQQLQHQGRPSPPGMPNMGNSPLLGSIPGYKVSGQPPPAPVVGGYERGVVRQQQQQPRLPLMNTGLGNSPLMVGFNVGVHQPPASSMGSSPLMAPMGGYNNNPPHPPQQRQSIRTPPMMGMNFNPNLPFAQPSHPRTQSMPFLTRQNSSVRGSNFSPSSAASH